MRFVVFLYLSKANGQGDFICKGVSPELLCLSYCGELERSGMEEQ